jgi:predicted dehydrogenase
LDALLADPSVDAVYVSVPTAVHLKWGLRAIAAGKHVLLEKPLALSAAGAAALQRAAAARGVVLMEAMHYRHHPVVARVRQVLRSGELGSVLRATARFVMFDKRSLELPAWLGGAAKPSDAAVGVKMLDRYIYLVDVVRLVTGEEPSKVLAAQRRGYRASAELEFPSGARATIEADSASPLRAPAWDVEVICERGSLLLRNFGFPFFYHRIDVSPAGRPGRSEQHYGAGETTFEHQLEHFAGLVLTGKQQRDGLADPGGVLNAARNLAVTDQLRRAFGDSAVDEPV